jgi:hypothetical protein
VYLGVQVGSGAVRRGGEVEGRGEEEGGGDGGRRSGGRRSAGGRRSEGRRACCRLVLELELMLQLLRAVLAELSVLEASN